MVNKKALLILLASSMLCASLNANEKVKQRKVFSTTITGEHLTKSEREAIKRKKELALIKEADEKKAKELAENKKQDSNGSLSGKEEKADTLDNRPPIERLTGKSLDELNGNKKEKVMSTNPITEITSQAPVITNDMRSKFKNSPSSEFKPR